MEKKDREKKPREVVVMLIQNDRSETLFVKRSSNRKFLPGVWSLPSGHIEEGENFRTTAIRELQEELNIQVVEEVGLREVINEPGGENTKVHLVDIPMNSYKGNPVVNSDEFESILWAKIEDFYARFRDEEIGTTLRHLRSKFQKND